MTFPPSEPPAEDYPDDDRPAGPPGYPPGPGYPPPGYGYGPPPGYPYYPPSQPKSRLDGGMAFVGVLLYMLVNFVIAFGALIVGDAVRNQNLAFGLTAVLLLLIAFGGGAALLRTTGRNTRGLGLGLMIGWGLTSLVTVGICTGINPMVYTG